MRFRRLPTSSLALTGVVGVVLAHASAYVLAFPQGQERAVQLQATGHGYWHVAVATAAMAAGTALAAALWRGWLLAQDPSPDPDVRTVDVRLGPLVSWQLALFAGMEILERIAAGVPPGVLLHSPEFGIGLILQVAVAWTALRLTRSIERVPAVVVAALRRRGRDTQASIRRPLGQQRMPRPVSPPSVRSRAPPVPAAL